MSKIKKFWKSLCDFWLDFRLALHSELAIIYEVRRAKYINNCNKVVRENKI